jgi:chloramphenicol-sensitive protein RarD
MTAEQNRGFKSALAAFIMWGALPAYWKMMESVPALQVLAHRIIWSVFFLLAVLFFQKRMDELKEGFADKKSMFIMFGTGTLLGSTWFTYIWAVTNGFVLETSLGYYISPMVSVVLGFLFLSEKIRGLMIPSIISVVAGIAYLIAGYGKFPFIALYLAFSFGIYGMMRKKVDVKPLVGLFFESLFLMPFAIIFLVYAHLNGEGAFGASTYINTLLLLSGAATSVPLIFFVLGARRLRLGTLGTLQYIAPTITFFIGVFLFAEPFGLERKITFSLIWLGVLLYLGQLYIDSRRSG